MLVISDSGPILSFARAGRLDLLGQLVGEITIPEAVFAEITIGGKGKPGAAEVGSELWIKRGQIKNRAALNLFSRRLNLGEMEALILAKEMNATLLIDEYEGRKKAARMGIEHFGSLRVLKEAKHRGIVPEVKPVLDALIAAGTYISDSLYNEFLRTSGEPKTP